MKEPFISLCSEITRENALTLIDWLSDEEVTRYLSDPKDVSEDIAQILDRVNLPVLTQLFNQNGRFYMAYNRQGNPVGFIRLVKKGADYEIVVVIGNRAHWNKKLGTAAIRESIRIAFLEFRAEKVIAKIYNENKRSLRAFENAGFTPETEKSALKVYSITMKRYLQILKGESAMRANMSEENTAEIRITKIDKERIKKLLDKKVQTDLPMVQNKIPRDNYVKKLEDELQRAVIVDSGHISPDVVTMNSRAVLQLDGEDVEVSLVYPDDANLSETNVSILSPIGTAILGYREGNIIEWEVPSGISEIHIKKILYQPEAAGDFHL